MKTIVAILLLVGILGCSKTEMTDTTAYQIIGQTYSGYSFTSSVDGHKVYVGYHFTSDTKATRMLLDENTRIINQVEYSYTGSYPNFKVGSFDGVFISKDILQIESLLMNKW